MGETSIYSEIEQALKDRIESKISSAVRDVKIQKGAKENLINPGVFVSVEDGAFVEVSRMSFRQDIDVYVEVEFQNLRGEEDRRIGAFMILFAIIQMLTLQTLGLNIKVLKPSRWQNVTSNEDWTAQKTRFQIIFKTAFYIEAVDDEVATDLLKVGLNYYLKPGDEIEDASDVLTLGE